MALASNKFADRRHAADQLGVAPEAAPAEVRVAFLRQLPAAGFLPAPPLCAAMAVLTGTNIRGAADASNEAGIERLQAAIASFSNEFWKITPPVRRTRWQELLETAAGDPLLAGRLRRLEAGVDLPDATSGAGPPRLREAAKMIQALFVLAPIERAARRRELLDNLPPPTSAWEQTARQIQQQQPALAALEPALVERMSHWRRSRKLAASAMTRPAASWGFQTQGGLQMPQVRMPAARSANRWSSGWAVFMLIGIVLGLVRAASGPTRVEPRFGTTIPPRSSYPSLSAPLRTVKFPSDNSDQIYSPKFLDELQKGTLSKPGPVPTVPGIDLSPSPPAPSPGDRRPP